MRFNSTNKIRTAHLSLSLVASSERGAAMTQFDELRHAFPLCFKSVIAQNGEVLLVQFDRQNGGRSPSDDALGQLAGWLDEAEARERLTLDQLAVLAGVDKSTISGVTRRLETLRPAALMRLQALRVPPNRLTDTARDA